MARHYRFISPNPILARVPCEKECGRVKVNSNLEVKDVNGLGARWVIARSFLIQGEANIVRQRRSMHRAKAKLSRARSSRAFAEGRKNRSVLKRLARSPLLALAQVSRGFSV
jgi:hypothetical protein